MNNTNKKYGIRTLRLDGNMLNENYDVIAMTGYTNLYSITSEEATFLKLKYETDEVADPLYMILIVLNTELEDFINTMNDLRPITNETIHNKSL